MAPKFSRQLELSNHPIKICVVGHTNHGKTSTIRTLIESAAVGEVVDGSDTTTRVRQYKVANNGFARFYVYDTPGFSNLDWRLAELQQSEVATGPSAGSATVRNNPSLIDQLIALLETDIDSHTPTDQMLRGTLTQIKKSDILIHVIDSRNDPYQETISDEIEFLRTCGVPLIVSLNFLLHSESRKEEWKKRLLSLGIANVINFDAHTRTPADERLLFMSIAPLLQSELHRDFMDYWAEVRSQVARENRLGAAEDMCQMLLKLSQLVVKVPSVTKHNKNQKQKEAKEAFQDEVMKLFDATADSIFNRYGFNWDDAKKHQEQVEGEHASLKADLFTPSKLRLGVASTAAAVTAMGELALGGVTLGFPTAFAFAAGFMMTAGYQWGTEQGGQIVTVRPSLAIFLALTNAALGITQTLYKRGKADDKCIDIRFDQNRIPKDSDLPALLASLAKCESIDNSLLSQTLCDAIAPKK